MKIKDIGSMAHNWTHSFMSAMNHVDDDYVFEDMFALARSRGNPTITWIPERNEGLGDLTARIQKSVLRYRGKLHDHLARHGLDASALEELRTEVGVTEDGEPFVRSFARDIRGRQYEQFVQP